MHATAERAATEAMSFFMLFFFISVHFLSNEFFYLQPPHRNAVAYNR